MMDYPKCNVVVEYLNEDEEVIKDVAVFINNGCLCLHRLDESNKITWAWNFPLRNIKKWTEQY